MDSLVKDGKSVTAQTGLDEKLMYKQLLRISEKEVFEVESDA